MSKCCKHCHYWLFTYESLLERFGTCDNSLVEAKVQLEKEYDGETVMYTEQYFGCIYYRENDGSLFSTDEIVKDQVFKLNIKEIVSCKYCNKPNHITNKSCIWCNKQFDI